MPGASDPEGLTISQLSAASQTSVATIKFYLREGLLGGGDLSAKRRAFYGEAHLRRLRVIFALRVVAGLSVQTIRDICRVLDARGRRPLSDAVACTMDALARRTKSGKASELASARAELLRFLRSKSVRVRSRTRTGTLDDLAAALVGLRHVIGPEVGPRELEPYLDAMCSLAEDDFRATRHLFADPTTAAEAVTLAAVLGTVLWEPVLVLLRRIAIEHVALREWRRR
jgi:DNA-binding transcriptional MerR regulator